MNYNFLVKTIKWKANLSNTKKKLKIEFLFNKS